MSDVTPDEKALFFEALSQKSPEELLRYLDQACVDNAQLRSRVEELLRAHQDAGNFLGGSSPSEATIDQPITEKSGTVIDRYKLLEQIGEGGFGVVFMAEQEEPVRRKVALKIIKPGMDTKEVIARFEAERQALAIMDHPNIAKVLDAGATESGRPYFVMELVRGISITDFCDQNSLSTRERLELFALVCQAVQHAHQKGIIHRDIKPSNVMVTMHDDTPVPKVIDFGVAKATNARLTERTLFTRFAQMIGTPLYMSPEQAQMSGLDVDTRSDIYSLGVLLYELLTGTTPFDRKRIREAAYDELLRIIREEDPPKPSQRISTLGDTLPSVAAQRKLQPKKLSALMRGELDWIVMKALEKDRTRRYETATSFSADIQRYLCDETVQACPPSAAYRFGKFARRNKTTLATAGMVAAALLVGLVGTTSQAIRANAQRDIARTEEVRAVKAEKAARDSQLIAETAKESETELRRQAEAQLARSYVERGLRLGEEGDQMSSLIWFAEALKLEQEDPLRDAPHRIRLAAAARRCPKLVQVCFHTGPMRSAQFSPDGKCLLTTDHEQNKGKAAQVWSLASGELIALLEHNAAVRHASFSPDGRRVVTAGNGGEARVWDALTGRPVTPVISHEWNVNYATFSPDGRRVLTASGEDHAASGEGRTGGEARLWDAASGESIGEPLDAGRCVLRAWFSADGQRIITAKSDHPGYSVDIWDIAAGERVEPAPRLDLTYQYPAHVSRDRQRLITLTTGTRPKVVRVWELDTAQMLTEVRPHGLTSDTSISSDGSRIVTPCYEGSVPIWDAASGAPITSLNHGQGFTAAAFNANNRKVVTVSNWDNTCRVWQLAPEDDCIILQHNAGVRWASFSPNGRLVVTASFDKTARVWDAATGRPLTPPMSHGGPVLHASFSPDGRRVVTATEGGEARVWNTATGQPVTPIIAHGWDVQYATFSPDGRAIVTASGKKHTAGEARVWDSTTGQPLTPPLEHTDFVEQATFSPDGRRVLTASWDKTARVWDAATGQPVFPPLKHATKVSSASFSRDGRLIVTSCWGAQGVGKNGTAQVWDAATGKPITPPIEHPSSVCRASFSPDGTRLATACFDGNARVWDARTGRQLTPEMPHKGSVYQAEFSADGLLLVTAASGNTSRVWDAATGQAVTAPMGHGGTGLTRQASFSPDGRSVITASSGPDDSTARIWALPRSNRPLPDLMLFAQLLGGHRIEPSGGLGAIDPAEFREIYETLRSKYPEDFVASPEEVEANE